MSAAEPVRVRGGQVQPTHRPHQDQPHMLAKRRCALLFFGLLVIDRCDHLWIDRAQVLTLLCIRPIASSRWRR